MSTSSIDRRKFIQITGITGTGFLLGLQQRGFGKTAVASFTNEAAGYNLSPYILIEKSGGITIFNTRPEIGQGTAQSIPALICEELEVPLEQVTIKQSGGEKQFGAFQGVGGSYSVRGSYMELRKVGASAREMLLTAASQQWSVPVTECRAEAGKVIHASSGKSLTYGELAEAASKLQVPKKPVLKDPKDFKILGKAAPRPDVPLKSSGRAVFGIDADVPGMVYASVEFCPVIGGKLISVDDAKSKAVTGVSQVEKCERIVGIYRHDGVAVIADTYWAALQGRKALNIKWDKADKEAFSSLAYNQKMRNLAKEEGKPDNKNTGDDTALYAAPVLVEAFYETPFVSHSPIEPMNCTAHWKDDGVEIWTSTQVPSELVSEVSREFGLPAEKVKLNVPYSGGAFGRRLINDYVLTSVALSKKIGKPVKQIWTREDDTRLGPFRPPTFSLLKAGLGRNGMPMAFRHKVISPSIEASMDKRYDKGKMDKGMTEGISDQDYLFPNMKNSHVFADVDIPLLYWRAVTSTTLAFAHECFIDEMAVKAGKDPLGYRLSLLKENSSTYRLLQKLKEVSGWEKPLQKGKGRGVAQYKFFAGQCGHVVEVTRKGDGVTIDKVWSVIDMGTVVNPDTVKAQVEGAVVMAITAAIKNGITFDKGQTVQSNFNNNPILRISEMPDIEVHILTDQTGQIFGAGEPGLPPLAPALCNAVFAATGKRIRKLPFDVNKIA
jgi:isoquinoline 1-oxidoreductase beta subunit